MSCARRGIGLALVAGVLFVASPAASALEEAQYQVIKQSGALELRSYAPQILVETQVEGEFKRAGNRAFSRLFDYISGANHRQQKIAMTAPVSQESGEKIEMTRPVVQDAGPDDRWRVSFLVPSRFDQETVPQPTDPAVYLRSVPEQLVAVIRYSGTWSEENFNWHLADLRAWIERHGWTEAGSPRWARYDPPFKPWFMRRNEILIAVETGGLGLN